MVSYLGFFIDGLACYLRRLDPFLLMNICTIKGVGRGYSSAENFALVLE